MFRLQAGILLISQIPRFLTFSVFGTRVRLGSRNSGSNPLLLEYLLRAIVTKSELVGKLVAKWISKSFKVGQKK